MLQLAPSIVFYENLKFIYCEIEQQAEEHK